MSGGKSGEKRAETVIPSAEGTCGWRMGSTEVTLGLPQDIKGGNKEIRPPQPSGDL